MTRNQLKWILRIFGILSFFAIIFILTEKIDIKSFVFEYNQTYLKYHLYSCVGFTFSTCLFFFSYRTILIVLSFTTYLVFPIMAPVFFICLMVTLIFSKKLELLSDFHDESAPQNLNYESSETFEESIQKNVNVEPLVEIIRSHHLGTDFKRGAIETLTQICDPVSITLLKECLSDPDTEVRFYASSGLSRIEEDLNKKIIKYKEKTSKDDAVAEDFFNYGSAYYEFIYLALQEKDSLTYYLNMAIDNFLIAFKRNKTEKKYKDSLQKAYANADHHDNSDEIEKELLGQENDPVYIAETLFKERKMSECRDLLQNHESKWNVIQGVKELWNKPQLD